MSKITIKDVANMAEVSISTVSNVISKSKYVSAPLTKKVEKAIQTLHYEVNTVARNLKSNHSGMIGVIITSFKSVFVGRLLNGIQDTCLKSGYTVCVYESNNCFQEEKKCLDRLLCSMVDGIILLSCADIDSPEEYEYIQALSKLRRGDKRIPVVSLEKSFDEPEMNCVISDNEDAGYTAVRHLIDLGHRRIGVITGPMRAEMCRLRMQGYHRAMSEAGLEEKTEWVRQGDFSPISGYHRMRELLDETKITAVFAMNDQSAIGAIKAVRDAGKNVPEDIAVIGFDNIFPGTLITPSLSTIDIPKYQMGMWAVRRLADLLDGKKIKDKKMCIGNNLIVRRSTDIHGNNSWDLFDW